MTPFLMQPFKVRLVLPFSRYSNLRLESMWVSLEGRLNSPTTFGFMFEIVVAVFAVTIHAELSIGEALAVKLEA